MLSSLGVSSAFLMGSFKGIFTLMLRMFSAGPVPVSGFFHSPKQYDDISKNGTKYDIPYLFLYQPYPLAPADCA